MMQLSIYTYIFQYADSFYLYNSEHGIIANISERLYSLLYNRDFNSIPHNSQKVLIEKGILVESDKKYMYYNEMKMRFLSASYEKEHMGLVIVPFTGCNFDCPYCFESKKHPKLMSENIENELIDFVNAHSASNIALTWYGGEPLVAFKNIKSIYNKFSNEFKEKTITIYPGFIREETPDHHSLCYHSIDSQYICNFYEKIKDLGGNVNFFPQKASKGCMINKLNSYIIGPEGEIYKCWNDVSNTEKIVGYINKKQITNKPLLYRYMNETTPFSNSQCKDCLLFPVCSGGCAWYQYKNIFENGRFNICSQFKERSNLEKALIKSLEKQEKSNTLKQLYV